MSYEPVEAPPPAVSPEDRRFTLRQRILLSLITNAACWAIRLICPTLRYSVSWEVPPASSDFFERHVIYSFWHRAIFPAAWPCRNQGIAVMVSKSFDGEYIARIIERLGFAAVRGSSSRGGTEALLGMRAQMQTGTAVAFTIDGPRGPKYVAKRGPVLLARATGFPMAAFYLAVSNAWVLNTWDQLMIPKPFAKVLVRASARIPVPDDADDSQMKQYHAQLQAALDRVTAFAEANVSKVGSAEFPVSRF